MDPRTQVPEFDRQPLQPPSPDARIAPDVPVLDDVNPFPPPVVVPPKEVTIQVGLARSTFHTREPEEVLSAAQPFIDLTQKEVDVRCTGPAREARGDLSRPASRPRSDGHQPGIRLPPGAKLVRERRRQWDHPAGLGLAGPASNNEPGQRFPRAAGDLH
jgi:hypothetical protein